MEPRLAAILPLDSTLVHRQLLTYQKLPKPSWASLATT